MDKSTLASMALGLLGEQEYIADTPCYEAIELYFGQTLRGLLSAADWSFARSRRTLTAKDDGSFAIPSDCLRIIKLDGLKHWGKYGQFIQPEDRDSAKTITLIYTSSHLVDCGEIPENIPEFIACFVEALAAATCMRILNDKQRRYEHMQTAQQLFDTALTHDIQQDNSNDQHPYNRLIQQSITETY